MFYIICVHIIICEINILKIRTFGTDNLYDSRESANNCAEHVLVLNHLCKFAALGGYIF